MPEKTAKEKSMEERLKRLRAREAKEAAEKLKPVAKKKRKGFFDPL